MMRHTGWSVILSIITLAGTLGYGTAATAHALEPGYLELRQIDVDLYAVLWKKPSSGGVPMAIEVRLPEQCDPRSEAQLAWDGRAYYARWTAACRGGLEGGRLQIAGLEQTSTDVLVRFEFADGITGTYRLTPTESSFVVPGQPGRIEVMRTYFGFGVEHILTGIDHLLFVLALLLLVRGLGRIIATITAFTLAHSITMAGATLGWVHMPGPPIEATIALSIAFVAAEIIHSRQGRPGLAARYPWIVAFTFGLLHGFGFAGALAQVGLPQGEIPLALLFFNVGVEVGQLLFIAALFTSFWLLRRIARGIDLSRVAWASVLPAYVIGSLAIFWVLQRTAQFFS
jgi:hydrogenase/urease accessory protein HupE